MLFLPSRILFTFLLSVPLCSSSLRLLLLRLLLLLLLLFLSFVPSLVAFVSAGLSPFPRCRSFSGPFFVCCLMLFLPSSTTYICFCFKALAAWGGNQNVCVWVTNMCEGVWAVCYLQHHCFRWLVTDVYRHIHQPFSLTYCLQAAITCA